MILTILGVPCYNVESSATKRALETIRTGTITEGAQLAKPRILFYDIETSLQPVAVFSLLHNDYIDPSSILSERYIISGSWKWEGKKEIHAVSVLDDAKRYRKNPHDDYHVVKTLHKLLSDADVIVGHNSDSFDKRWIETRALIHGFPALPPIASIDTFKVAKARLYLNSNKLDYIGRLLGVGRKIKTTNGLWLRVLHGDKQAVKEMVRYNKQDVALLEQVYLKLRPYVANHISRELFGGVGCPRCGSTKIQSRGGHRAISRVYRRWQCQKCSGWFKSNMAEPGTTQYRVL